jgi:uncharacterized protein (TIGR02145 family)
MKTLHYFLLSILFLSSCDKFEWYNPYDPECPKELFTPSSPGATMEGNSIRLTWTQENDYISGFALFRSADGESITNLTQTQKSTTQYLDANFTPGKRYTYYIVAVAGTNKSDTVKAEIVPVIPVSVSTGVVTEVAATSAKVSGNISNAGGGTVTTRGICWSTTPNPTVSNSKTTEGTGIGQFVSALTNLLPSTTYYARAYGENSRGVSYGSEISFTTLGPPKLTTTAVTNITATSATSGGTITSDGGSPITANGVVWSTSPNPTIALATKTNDGTGSGVFVSTLTNLNAGSTYYARAYAENISGVSYGSEIVFTTNESATVIDIDGNAYPTVKICNQIWMAENLKVSKYRNGDPILNIQDNNAWANTRSGAWCNYNNDSPNDLVYGKLYNGYAVTDARGLAPAGWHIPTKTEWDLLITCLSNDQVNPANKMKTVTGWSPTNIGATNSSGFSGLPGGTRSPVGQFINLGSYGYWYSTTFFTVNAPNIIDPIWFSSLSYEQRGVYQDTGSKISGLSVRCIKD